MNRIYITILVIFFACQLKAQDILGIIEENNTLNYTDIALDLFNNKKYFEAIFYFEQSIKNPQNTENYELYYKLAECYRNSRFYQKAESLYKKVVQKYSHHFPEALYWYAKMQQANEKYENAILSYTAYLNKYLDTKSIFIDNTRKEIISCKISLKELKKTIEYSTEILNQEINKKYSVFCPFINNDSLLFASSIILPEKKTLYLENIKGKYNYFFADRIFLSVYSSENNWQQRKELTIDLEDQYSNIFSPVLSLNKKKIYYTLCVNNKKEYCSLCVSDWNNGKISTPIILPTPINLDTFNSKHPFIANINNQEVLFFSSDRPSGFGGFDLYYTIIDPSGRFSKVINLGNSINTKSNEISPFYQSIDTNLFFASTGYYGFGNYDIYKTKGAPTIGWEKVLNCGYPINSGADDIFYFASNDKKWIFISSNRINKKFASESSSSNKIYQVIKAEKIIPMITISGIIKDSLTQKPIIADLYILDRNKSKIIDSIKTDENGKYKVTIPSKNEYDLEIVAKNYMFEIKQMDLTTVKARTTNLTTNIQLQKIKIGLKVVLKNIYFDSDSSVLKPESFTELDKVMKFLNQNPNIVMEISGHTDNIGTYEYNKILSEERAKNVVAFLTKMGIASNLLIYKGYSYDQPIVTNDTEDGRLLNRRVEFKVIDIK